MLRIGTDSGDVSDSDDQNMSHEIPNFEQIFRALRTLKRKNPSDPILLEIKTLLDQPDAGPSKKPRLDMSCSTGSKRLSIKQSGGQQKKSRTAPLSDKVQHYAASGLKLSLHGTVYQVKLLMLFVKRAIGEKYDFRLASEMDAAEKFDDIVFKFRDDQGKWIYRFVQAKHKLESEENKISVNDLITTSDENFSLQKYFVSYYKIIHEKLFKDGELRDFIICTNTDFDFEINRIFKIDGQEMKVSKERNDMKKKWNDFFIFEDVSKDDKILYFGKKEKTGRFMRGKRDEIAEIIKSVLEKKVKDNKSEKKASNLAYLKNMLNNNNLLEYIKHFIDKLTFIINYPTEKELGELIKGELQTELHLLNADLISDSFEKKMLEWLKRYSNKGATFFSWLDGEDFFDSTRENIRTLMTVGLTKAYPEKLKSYGIFFASQLKELETIFNLDKNTDQIFVIHTQVPLLSSIKVLQTIEKSKFIFTHLQAEDSYIFVSLKTLMIKELQAMVLNSFWSTESHHLLVIVCEPHNNLDEITAINLSDKLLQILNNPIKKVIVVTQNEDNFTRHFKTTRKYNCLDDYINFKMLDSSSQENVLKKIVNFQGKKVELNKLLHVPIANEIIDHLALLKLVEENNMEIGDLNYSTFNGYEPDYYINRNLHRQEVEQEIFRTEDFSDVVLFITGADEQTLTSVGVKVEDICLWNDNEVVQGKVIVYNSQNNPVNALQMFYDQYQVTIHWLEYLDEKFIWRNTRGNWATIRKFIKPNHESGNKNVLQENYFNTEESFQQKVVVLANDAGVGKSMMLTNFARKLKKKYPFYWVVRLNLNDFTKKGKENCLENILFEEHDVNGAIEFVSKMAAHHDSDTFERMLFKAGLQQGINAKIVYPQIFMLFDGFDEISPTYKEKTRILLSTLKKTSVVQLWVTTRLHEKSYIEEELESPAYVLNLFRTIEQKDFISKFWKWNLMFKRNLNNNKVYKRSFEEINELINDFPAALKDYLIFRGLDKLDLYEYAETMLEEWKKTIYDANWEFTSVPLNLKMLAEVVLLKKFQLPENLGLVNLYDEFIRLTFDIYHKEKSKTFVGNVAASTKDSVFFKISREVHQELALKLFFPDIALDSKIDVFKEPGKPAEEELARVGLLSLKGNDLEFIHRSFAEYFFSEFLCDKKNLREENIQNILLNRVLYEDNYELIRKFFDACLEKNILLSMTLNNNMRVKFTQEFESSDQDKSTIVHIAAKEGCVRTLKFLLYMFLEISSSLRCLLISLKRGASPLHSAARYGKMNVICMLLDFVKDNFTDILKRFVMLPDEFGYTTLHHVSNMNDVKSTEILTNFTKEYLPGIYNDMILATDNSLTPDNKMRTILHVVAEKGYDDFIVYLFKTLQNEPEICKTLIFKSNRRKETALHIAASTGHADTVQILLNVIRENLTDIDMFKQLILSQDLSGETVLFLAARSRNTKTVENLLNFLALYPDILTSLALQCNRLGESPLYVMSTHCDNENIFIFLNTFANEPELLRKLTIPETEDKSNALHWFVMDNRYEVVDFLLQIVQKYSDILEKLILSRNRLRDTPFSIAYNNKRNELMNCILKNTENHICIKDKLISHRNWLNEVSGKKQHLKEKGFLSLVMQGNMEEIKKILKENSSETIKELLLETDCNGKTVLILAIEQGYCEEIIGILLENISAFKLLMLTTDNDGKTALHLAVEKDEERTVQLLINSLVNYPDTLEELMLKVTEDMEGYNALHVAAEKGQHRIVGILLKAVNCNHLLKKIVLSRNYSYKNALHLACWNGHFKVVKELLQNAEERFIILKEMVQQPDFYKQTSLKLTAFKNYWDIAILLLKAGANISDLTSEQCEKLKEYLEDSDNMSEESEDIFKKLTEMHLTNA